MRTEKSSSSSTSAENWEEIDEHLDYIESFQDFRREERIALTKFIQAYESLPCLWNRKDPTFNSKIIKDEAYKQLAAVSKQLNPNAGNVDWVKNKITGLRAVFFRDYKKVVDSLKAGKGIFIPKLWYFGLMLFVTESEDENVLLNEKIRSLLNLKPTATFGTDIEITGLITEKEKSDYRAAITEFISIYKSEPCLWNSSKSLYIDKDLKSQAHQKLLKSARSHFPGVDVEWVKMKIHKLRAVFWREHRKRERAVAAGVKVASSLWYYDQLFFITEAENKTKPKRINMVTDSSADDPLEELCEDVGADVIEEPLKYNYAADDCLDDFDLAQAALDGADPGWNLVDSASDINPSKINMSELLLNTDSSQSLEQIPTSSSPIISKPVRKKRKKAAERDVQPVMIHLPELPSTSYNAIDELNAFSTSMTAKLRRMTQEQRDLAELEIGRILFLGLRGRLVDSTILPPIVEDNYPDCTL